MKKIMLLIILVLIFPTKTNALEYEVKLSGEDTISSKPNNPEDLNRAYTSLFIDITNFENIDSFTMYVKFDKNLIGLNTCNLFNYISEGCYITNDKTVFYNYKYNDGYSKYFNNYRFYRVGFMPIDTTPDSGTTTVEVSFENAKDKNQNPITIKSSSKTYTFRKPGMIFKSNDNESTNSNTLNEDEKNNNNDDIINYNNENNTSTDSTNQKSNNNYINKLKIENYDIDFNKDKNNYTIDINNDINKLNIEVILDDSKATYKIIGEDDLKANNYEVYIDVISESGKKNTYIIKTNITNDTINTINKDNEVIEYEDNEKNFIQKINKKHFVIAGISFIFIILIIAIISHINNKKIDKMFKGL